MEAILIPVSSFQKFFIAQAILLKITRKVKVQNLNNK